MRLKRLPTLVLFGIVVCLSCNHNSRTTELQKTKTDEKASLAVKHAKSFSIKNHEDYTILEVNKPWPGATKSLRYLVAPKENLAQMTFSKDDYDAIVVTPVQSLIATSTTHIPALESLDALHQLVGFPDTKYISSMPARDLINKGSIQDLGNNERINTEMVLALQPDIIVGFSIDNQTNAYEIFQKAGIPVVLNSDWTEETPLGKAEWIKFFGVLLDKRKEADSLFSAIERSYLNTKQLALKATSQPTVLSGALYKDVWYLPSGKSWAAQFIEDARGNYLYRNTSGNGSLALGLERVLEKGHNAEFWIGPSQHRSYDEMKKANSHYTQFKAFHEKKVYTFANTRGSTGGMLYYELAPQRPDVVLKDLVHIFHPELLPDHTPFFFTPLQ